MTITRRSFFHGVATMSVTAVVPIPIPKPKPLNGLHIVDNVLYGFNNGKQILSFDFQSGNFNMTGDLTTIGPSLTHV